MTNSTVGVPAPSDIDWERCPQAGCIGAVVADQQSCLAHLEPGAAESALRRFTRGRPLDARGVVFDVALWDKLLKAAPVDGMGRRRLSGGQFDRAIFNCDVVLDDCSFPHDARFDSALFSGDVSFKGTQVLGQARFSNATFESDASFEGARLDGPAWFARARFAKNASFRSVAFGGQSWFNSTAFASDANFDAATFGRHAAFEKASFGCHAYFALAVFEADGRFVEAEFARPGDFEGALFKGLEGLPDVAEAKQVKWWGPPLAPWGMRARGALIDFAIPAAILVVAALAAMFLVKLQDGFVAVVAAAAGVLGALWFSVRNIAAQGDTGQSLGKRKVGLRLLDERSRRPVGTGRALGRHALHLLDTAPLLTGWLWPLRDEKKRTFADCLLKTVVVVVGDNFHRANAPRPPERVAPGGG